jgi:hypothetical protein
VTVSEDFLKANLQALTLSAVQEGKDRIWLIRRIDASDCLGANGLWIQSLGLRETCRMVDIVAFTGTILLVVVVRIELWRVLAALDFARCQHAEQCHLDLPGSLRNGALVVGIVGVSREEVVVP